MTLGELVGKIQDDLIDVRVTPSQIVDAINESTGFYKRMTFYFNDGRFSFNMVAGQEYYDEEDEDSIPNIFEIVYLTLVAGNQTYHLVPMLDAQIEMAQNNGVSASMPYAYSYAHQKIRVFPIPDTSGKFTCSATEKKLGVEDMSATSVWLTEASELIRAAAKVRIALNKFNDANLAQGPAAMEQKELGILQAETRKRTANIPLRVDNGLMPASVNFYDQRRTF